MQFSSRNDSCKGVISEPNQINGFTQPGSRYQLAPIIAKLSAASLVAASAGLGAVYAGSVVANMASFSALSSSCSQSALSWPNHSPLPQPSLRFARGQSSGVRRSHCWPSLLSPTPCRLN